MGKVMQIFKIGFLSGGFAVLVVCDNEDEAKEKALQYRDKVNRKCWGKPYLHSILAKVDDCVFLGVPQKNV